MVTPSNFCPALTRRRLLRLAQGLAVSALLAGCGKKLPQGRLVTRGATVLALGDSITFGTGAGPDSSYPSVLAHLSGWNVVNGGVPGNTSEQALHRLPALLAAYSPQLVLVSIGGNDFLRRLPQTQTRANIAQICQQSVQRGAQVVLLAVPQLSLMAAVAHALSDHPMYADLASELHLPLHENGWSDVLTKPELRADAIHANALGYAQFAEGLAQTLRKAGLLA